MNKISMPISNDFCPQTMFLYGTYKEDGTPNFGLFSWFSYCWDGELCVMACIGGEKLTKDRIRSTGIFSANLVSEALLPLADYYGNIEGYDPHKMEVMAETMPGQALNVPVLKDSPWSFELEVKKTLSLDDSDIFVCKIKNIMADESLKDEGKSMQERILNAAPVTQTCQSYFSFTGKYLGKWGEPKAKIKHD